MKEKILFNLQAQMKHGDWFLEALEDEEACDLTAKAPPTPREDPSMSEFKKKIESTKWDTKWKSYSSKCDSYEKSVSTTFAHIYTKCCEEALQKKLREEADFESTIRGNPFVLLQRIKQILLTPKREEFWSITATNTLNNLTNCKQGLDEDLNAYRIRMEDNQTVVIQQLGDRFLDYYIEHTPKYQQLGDTVEVPEPSAPPVDFWSLDHKGFDDCIGPDSQLNDEKFGKLCDSFKAHFNAVYPAWEREFDSLKSQVKEAESHNEKLKQEQEEMKAGALTQHFAWQFIQQALPAKYESYQLRARQNYAAGTMVDIPLTLFEAYERVRRENINIPSNWKEIATKKKSGGGSNTPPTRAPRGLSNMPKEEFNHYAYAFAQMERGDDRCYCCGKTGHKSPACTQADTLPKAKWWIHKNAFDHHKAIVNGQLNIPDSIGEGSDEDASSGSDDDDDARSRASTRSRKSSSRSTISSKSKRSGRSGKSSSKSSKSKSKIYSSSINPSYYNLGVPATAGTTNKAIKKTNKKRTLAEALRDNVVLLDSATTCGTAASKKYCPNAKHAEVGMTLSTNGGLSHSNKKGTDALFALETWYNDKFAANLAPLGILAGRYRVTMDSAQENAFYIHREDDILCVPVSPEGLYPIDLDHLQHYSITEEEFVDRMYGINSQSKSKKKHKSYSQVAITTGNHKSFDNVELYPTVKKTMEGFTKTQIKRAAEVRHFYHTLGAPGIQIFRHAIKIGSIQDCNLTTKDVDNAETIWGPSLSGRKGRTTRAPADTRAEQQPLEIPKQLYARNRQVELHLDYFSICGIWFLASIDDSYRYRKVVWAHSKKDSEALAALDVILRIYNSVDIEVTRVHADPEFASVVDKAKDGFDVQIHTVSAGEHVPKAERNIRTIKDRFRIQYYRLPYRAIPAVMIRFLAYKVADQLNYFPAKGGISKTYSPQQLLELKKLDYKRDCRFLFGTYGTANEDPGPIDRSRPIAREHECIYLRFQDDVHQVMDLYSGEVRTKRRFTPMPLSKLGQEAVEKLAERDDIDTLKFADRDGNTIHDEDLIAGVDFDD